jgi:hypothetical protein
MVESKNVLEGGFRMVRIRQTKIYLYAVQLILVLAIVIFLVQTEGGFSLKPFYLPLSAFIYFLILMLLVFNIESCFFRGLEMRFLKTDSGRYYMTKRSMRRALIIIAIAAAVIIILWVPAFSEGVENTLSDSGQIDGVQSFYNKDFLGLITTDSVSLSCDGEAVVYIVTEDNFLLHLGNMDLLAFYRINSNNFNVDPAAYVPFAEASYGKYYFVVDYRYSDVDVVDYTLHQDISPTFTGFVPLFATFFIIVNVGWLAYLIPMRKKYAEKAIYK